MHTLMYYVALVTVIFTIILIIPAYADEHFVDQNYFENIKTLLSDAKEKYNQNDVESAKTLVYTAYLDNYENLEESVENIDAKLNEGLEIALRHELIDIISRGDVPSKFSFAVDNILEELHRAQLLLATIDQNEDILLEIRDDTKSIEGSENELLVESTLNDKIEKVLFSINSERMDILYILLIIISIGGGILFVVFFFKNKILKKNNNQLIHKEVKNNNQLIHKEVKNNNFDKELSKLCKKANSLARDNKLDDALSLYIMAQKIIPSNNVIQKNLRVLEQLKSKNKINYKNEDYRNIEKIMEDVNKKIEEKKFSDALNLVDMALLMEPNNSILLNNKGKINALLKNYEYAIKYFDAALRINSDTAIVFKNKIDVLLQLGKSDDAKKCLDESQKLFPLDNQLILKKAIILNDENNLQDAKKCLDELLKNEPNNQEAFFQYGSILEKEKNYSESLIMYKKAESCDGSNSLLCLSVGDVFRKTQQYEKSLDYYKKAVEQDDDNYVAINNMGLTLVKIKEFGMAKKCFKKALSYDGNNSTIKQNLMNLEKF